MNLPPLESATALADFVYFLLAALGWGLGRYLIGLLPPRKTTP